MHTKQHQADKFLIEFLLELQILDCITELLHLFFSFPSVRIIVSSSEKARGVCIADRGNVFSAERPTVGSHSLTFLDIPCLFVQEQMGSECNVGDGVRRENELAQLLNEYW